LRYGRQSILEFVRPVRLQFCFFFSKNSQVNNVYPHHSRKRSTPLSLLEVKLTFLLLCDSQSFEQLVKEHNILTADHNFCVSRVRFESMVHILAKLCACLDDNEQFEAKQTNQIVYECFEELPGLVGLNEYQFSNIWRSGVSANFTIYANILRLVRRLQDSQENLHHITCAGCQASHFNTS
jgi:hypothetical protein